MRLRKGQSILEFTTLLCIIISSILIMQVFLKRSYQGKLKEQGDIIGSQYSPGHTTSTTSSSYWSTTESHTGGQTSWGVDVPEDVTINSTLAFKDTDKQEAVDSFATEE